MSHANSHTRARILLRLAVTLVLLAGAVWASRADNDGVYLTVKSGQPDALVADGKSRTILEAHIDPAAACWKQATDPEGSYSLQVGTSLGTIDPTFAAGKLAQYPMALTLTAGTSTGTARVEVRASYCTPGAVGAFGVCTDQQSQQNVCLADLAVPIGEGAPPAPPAEKPPESPELSASASCTPPNPVEGSAMVCTVQVEGAREDENVTFVWYIDSEQVALTLKPTWTWGSAVLGKESIGVDVLGDGRSKELTVPISVQAKETEQGAETEAQPAQPGAQPPPAGGEPAKPGGGPSETGEGQVSGGAEPPDVRQRERPFKPSREDELPDVVGPGEAGSAAPGNVEARRPIEALIEGPEGSAPTPREAALAGLTTAAVVAAKLALDLTALGRRAEQVRNTTPDLPPGSAPAGMGDAMQLGVEARGPDLPPVRGDALGPAPSAAPATDAVRQALERTVSGVPPALRNSMNWQQRIAPLLEQAKRWNDPARLKALEERIQAIVDLRRQIDNNPAYRRLPKHHQEALIWKRRGDGVLGAVRPQDRERLFNAPSKRPRVPAGSGAGAPEGEVEFIDDLRKYPVRRIESPFRAQQRQQGDDPVTRDLWQFRRVDPHRKGFESGWEKAKRWRRELGAWWDEVRFGIPRKRTED